jgi:phosphopantothenoylcysteine decarboxylase
VAWADVLVIAPLSANALAEVALGLCSNLVTRAARAIDPASSASRRGGGSGAAAMVVAPAMNTRMWEHPATAAHVAALVQRGVAVVPPVSKVLACGDVGVGAMAPVDTIAEAVMITTATAKLSPAYR